MGFFFEDDTRNNLIRCTWQGKVSDDTLFEVHSAGGKLLAARRACKVIDDFSGVTQIDISSEAVRRLANLPSAVPQGSVHVIVAPQDLMFGLSRMYSILGEASHPNLHVVRTVKEAYELLGVTSPEFSRVSAA